MSSPRVGDICCVISGFSGNLTAPGGGAASAKAVTTNNGAASLIGSGSYYQGSRRGRLRSAGLLQRLQILNDRICVLRRKSILGHRRIRRAAAWIAPGLHEFFEAVITPALKQRAGARNIGGRFVPTLNLANRLNS